MVCMIDPQQRASADTCGPISVLPIAPVVTKQTLIGFTTICKLSTHACMYITVVDNAAAWMVTTACGTGDANTGTEQGEASAEQSSEPADATEAKDEL